MSMTEVSTPNVRRLRGYSFDPSLSVQLDTALVNEAVFKVRWEKDLDVGPTGEYLEVVDFDPASNCFYQPVDLNDPYILAQDGLVLSESNPKFHQQMVYAVAMTTIQNFEKALGRRALWSSYRKGRDSGFIQRLRIYPHALRQANAYYSPVKKALLFGYFPASSGAPEDHVPNGVVFTCLSHDIIAHETTHALLDGMHRRFTENTNPDTLAFHEAFADIVALFQHFTFAEVLRQQIARTRGDLASQSLLGELAQQFGKAIGQYGALRDAIGGFDVKEGKWKPHEPSPKEYQDVSEPHARGSILVAAVFEAFLSIYKRRVADLLRLASNGTGILTPGELHPDLVNRLADEAAKSAQHVLTMCIRALDYCPPVDITFGDYLRAIITADSDVFVDDELGYRIAFIEAFRRRGIYPRNIKNLSEESLCWPSISEDDQQVILTFVTNGLRLFVHHLGYLDDFPRLEELAALQLDVESLKRIMIPNRATIWNSLPETKRSEMWDELFAYERLLNGFIRPYPAGVSWNDLQDEDKNRAEKIIWRLMSEREKIFYLTRTAQKALHDWLIIFKADAKPPDVTRFEELTGLYLLQDETSAAKLKGLDADWGKFKFEVHSFRATQRVGPDDVPVNRVFVTITQQREPQPGGPPDAGYPRFNFRGGCTLVFDLQTLKLKYAVRKLIDNSDNRMTRQDEYRSEGLGASLGATYFGNAGQNFAEPFALLHSEV